jgi:DMSO/TMAO reductase YedYZ molybdopterin-dependent catalytic subunit
MAGVTRGFLGRRARDPRLPPGQYDVGKDWPVLTAEPTPRITPENWSITVDGLVEQPTTWTWDEAHALPGSEYRGDIHCVTTWTKFDTRFTGVSVDTLLELARPAAEAQFVMATSRTGYTTNLPLSDVTGGRAWIVWDFDGKPLPIEHGGPVRMLAKWITRITLRERDSPGFWEQNGYHDRGDPWREQRYQGD